MVLKCNAVWDGPIIQTLTVDLEGRWMRFGQYGNAYKIISMTDRYITGLQETDKGVGGELWLLDRETGEYRRATANAIGPFGCAYIGNYKHCDFPSATRGSRSATPSRTPNQTATNRGDFRIAHT
jgi:hypothetical protein